MKACESKVCRLHKLTHTSMYHRCYLGFTENKFYRLLLQVQMIIPLTWIRLYRGVLIPGLLILFEKMSIFSY